MRPIFRCEACGHRQTMVRISNKPESFRMICHDCERQLTVEVTADDIAKARDDGAARRVKVRT